MNIRKFKEYTLSVLLVYLVFLTTRRVHRVISPHAFDLNYMSIFHKQFQIYILTHACERSTTDLVANLKSVMLVPDVIDSPLCNGLSRPQLHLPINQNVSKAALYLEKYAQVLNHCAQGNKMKCLLLEDDAVIIYSPKRAIEVLVLQTLFLFNKEEDIYDCTKRGFGWLSSTHTGMGSQCRVISKPTAHCVSECLKEGGIAVHKQVDLGLNNCQPQCGLTQKSFLFAEHAGWPSTIESKVDNPINKTTP
jgi:hypothetical protein